MSDLTQEPGLTERLAAKLYEGPYFNTDESNRVARYADVVLPLLLSVPELVAGLAPEVRRSVLTERERAVMKLGEVAQAWLECRTEFWTGREFIALMEQIVVMREAGFTVGDIRVPRALTPEADNAE